MRRREFITLLGGAAGWVSPARAQEPRRVIGVLTGFGFPSVFSEAAMPAFFKGLRDAGFVEGRNMGHGPSAHTPPHRTARKCA
jgi:putative tryptophan/tyrosine transport system substrate-binding protein